MMRARQCRLGAVLVVAAVSMSTAQALRTGDGLEIKLDKEGRVSALRAGDVSVPLADIGSGFMVVDQRRLGKNRLPNSSLEAGLKGWHIPRNARHWSLDGRVAHTGKKSLRLTLPGRVKRPSHPALSPQSGVEPGRTYLVCAWVRLEEFWGQMPRLSLRLSADGKKWRKASPLCWPLYRAGESRFPEVVGTTEWFEVRALFTMPPDVRFARVGFVSPGGFGTAWIDDVSLVRPGAERVAFRGQARQEATGDIVQSAQAIGLRLTARYRPRQDRIEVTGKVQDTTGKDRPITLIFSLPVNAVGWRWGKGLTGCPTIRAGERYCETLRCHYWPDVMLPKLFFGCVWSRQAGLALAVPMSPPRQHRIFYSPTEGLALSYDLGLTSRTSKFPSSADFRFVIYRHDPKWGFRSALKKYFDTYPQFFKKRARKDGRWFLSAIPVLGVKQGRHAYRYKHLLEELTFAYDTGHARGWRHSEWDRRHDILCMLWLNEGPWWLYKTISVVPRGAQVRAPYPTDEDVATRLFVDTVLYPNRRSGLDTSAEAREVLLRFQEDEYGRVRLARRGYTWLQRGPRMRKGGTSVVGYRMIRIHLNTDPDIPAEHTSTAWDLDQMKNRKGQTHDWDGLGTDNTGRWHACYNFRSEHFALADNPAVFHPIFRRVALLSAFSYHEFFSAWADKMHRNGQILLCNGYAPYLIQFYDVAGCEGQFSPADVEYLRILGYQKPISSVQLRQVRQTRASYERRLQRALLLAEHPPGEDRHSHLVELEDLLLKYGQAIQEMSLAGWEPIPGAECAQPDVRIERFGTFAKGPLYFAVANQRDEARTVHVKLNPAALGLKPNAALVAHDVLADRELSCAPGRNSVVVEAPVEAERTIVLRVGTAAELERWCVERAAWKLRLVGKHKRSTRLSPRALEQLAEKARRAVGDAGKVSAILRELSATGEFEPNFEDVIQQLGRHNRLATGLHVRLSPPAALRQGAPASMKLLVSNLGRQAVRVEKVHLLGPAGWQLAATGVRPGAPLKAGAHVTATVRLMAPKVGPTWEAIGAVVRFRQPNGREVLVSSVARVGRSPTTPAKGVAAHREARSGLIDFPLPLIDGKADDQAWQQAAPLPEFFVYEGGAANPGKKMRYRTEARFVHSRDALYVLVKCFDPSPASIPACAPAYKGGDIIELYLDPGRTRSNWLRFTVESGGAALAGTPEVRDWPADWHWAVATESNCWVVEMAIPFRSLQLAKFPPKPGSRWGMNVTRQKRPRVGLPKEASTWSLLRFGFKDPTRFGTLTF